MSRFSSALDEQEALYHGPPCSTATMLASLDADSAVDLIEQLKGDEVHATTIVRALADMDVTIGAETLRNHRTTLQGKAGGCRCQTS